MVEEAPETGSNEAMLRVEVVRLNKIVQALMNRAERSMSMGASDFNMFQTAIMLEDEVRRRTDELEAALRTNERNVRALRESEAKFHGLVEQSLVGIGIVLDGHFSHVNPKLAAIFGYSVEELLPLALLDLAVESERLRVSTHLRQSLAGEASETPFTFVGVRKDGMPVTIEVASSPMRVSGQPALVTVLTDVSERVRAEMDVRMLNAQLREMAVHDALTGLFNRRYLEDAFERELARAKRHGHTVSIILGDLDHFKAVNDSYGHQAGDTVLRAFGRLMKVHARSSDISCRYGGEEFLLILPDMTEADAGERAEQLRAAVASMPILAGSAAIDVTASFGVASFPRHGTMVDQLISAADNALYAAKKAGRNRVEHAPSTPGPSATG